MKVLDICQEAVSEGVISSQLVQELEQILWNNNLNAVEMATLEFISQRIEAGKIMVMPKPIEAVRNVWQQVN
ncbi:MAG: hypothetical protein WBB82_10170 [Limnothrix sp.]